LKVGRRAPHQLWQQGTGKVAASVHTGCISACWLHLYTMAAFVHDGGIGARWWHDCAVAAPVQNGGISAQWLQACLVAAPVHDDCIKASMKHSAGDNRFKISQHAPVQPCAHQAHSVFEAREWVAAHCLGWCLAECCALS